MAAVTPRVAWEDTPSKPNEMALREAVREGRDREVNDLLRTDTHPDCPSCESSALDIALITLGSPASCRGIEQKIFTCIQNLLAHGADPNREGRGGMRPLHRAVQIQSREWSTKTTNLLLKFKADPSLKTPRGDRKPEAMTRFPSLQVLLLRAEIEAQESELDAHKKRLGEAEGAIERLSSKKTGCCGCIVA